MLSKGEIDSKKVRVEFSLEDMDMSGFQNDATYEQIKERVLQQTGLKVDYSCAMKSRFRKSGNQITGRRKSSLASLLA